MAKGFNLTAQLNLRGPSNIRPVIDNLRKQLGSINVSINPTIDPAAARNVTALQNSLGRLNSTLSQTTVLASNASRSISSLSTAIANVGSNIRTLPNNVNTATKSLNNASQAATTTKNNVTKAGNAFEYFGTQSALAVRRFAAFATVTSIIYKFTNAISSSSAEFIKFNTEIVRVSQVTDKSLKELGPLVKQITSLSTGLGVASRDLITVSSTLAQAGLSARDTEKALKALALSALAPSFDSLNDTVEGSIALMRQFGIGAKDLEGALGSVNAVAAAFAVESGDLITAIQRTGGVFAAASKGVSEGKDALNEFLAIFTSIRQTTRESAETIATGLRTIFTRIQRGKTIDALKEYGVVLTDLTGKFVGPFEATKRLAEGLARLDPRDLRFSQIVEELGGFRQIGKVIPLIQQFAVAQQALKVAQEGQGSLATDAATAQLALANRLTKVREEFNALIRSVGESKSFQTFVSLSLDLASALIRLADSAKNVLPALAAIAAFRGVRALTSFARGFGRNIVPQAASTGGKILGFSSGGVVPGSGRGDKVPALLEPGEVVMSNQAVRQYGRGNLVKMNRMASRDGERVRKVYESTRGPKQRAHIGADIQLTKNNIQKYVDKDTGYKSKKFFASAKQYAGLTKTKLREGDFNITKLISDMGLKAKDRVVLKLPASWNQALREGNKDLVSQDSLSAFLSRSARSQDLFSGQYNKLSTRSKTQTAQALSAKIQNLPAKKYNKSNDSSDKPNIPSFDKDKELDSLKNVLVEQLGQAEYIDLLFRSPKGDKSKTGGRTQSRSGARKDRISKMGGGLIQRFMKGGIAQRNVGYIDYDVIANPANEAVVTKGMERSGVTGPRLYADYLTDLAVKARKDSSLQKLRAVYGVAGSGKTTLARGQGTDQGKLRKTNRFPVLTPEDIQKANEVLILSSSVSKDKLDSIFSEVDRAYTLSSTTPAEKERIKAQRASRDTTGIGLEGRTPGGTTGVGKDTAVGEALLQDRLGSRSVVLGRSDSGKLRRKRGDELVQIIKKKIGFTWGGFAPMTVGHESILDAAAAQGISPKDFIFLVGANEGINDADASSYRTAIFDQDARVLLARAGAGARGATVLPKARDFETPLGFDISGESGRRKVVLPSKGSKVFVGEEKGANLTSKYKEAGYDVASIARTGGISATKVRELIEKGDLGGLQKLLSPGVYDLISNNIGRIQNRAKVLPDIIAQVKQSQAVKIGDIEKAIQALGISRIDKKKLVDPEYAAKVQILEELRSQRDKIKSAAALEPYKLLEQLARSQPDQYGLDFSAKTAPTTKPIRTVGATQRASIGGLIQRFMAGGRPDETTPWGDTATVPEILRLLTFGGAAKIGRVENPRELLKKKKPTEDEKAKIKAIRDEATKTYNRRIGAGKGVQTRLAGQGLKFAAVGMFGNPFPDETYDAQGTKGTRKVLITASIMDQALAKELDADFGGGIESTAQQAAEKAMVGNITKGVLGGKQLELDFDRTLAVGADDIATLTDFRDPTIVQEKLKRATLTRLGSALVGLVKTHPELTSNMRVVTARSQSTVPLIQQWLASKGLVLPISQFVGVGGDAQIISESDIPALKAAQLRPGSLFVDDSGANIGAAQASGKDIETYQYGAQSTIPNPNAEATVKGVLFEKMIQNLGGPGRVAGLGFDYPKGLGVAAKYFGIDPDIPTDAKRTIVGPSTIKDNIRTYLKAMRYKGGGKADDQGFETVRKQIMDKYPDIDFRISKRKKGRGFGYNILGALKTDGGLLGSKGLQFEQPSNLQKLIEVSDKMATSLIKSQKLAIGGRLIFADGGSVPALVSNGEAYVPPKLAKKIGYGTLNRMNQADRNGMGRFSSGGISVFKGPGSGTSDSIPTSLPVGSFIIREKATKALGLRSGGSVGIQKYSNGSKVIENALGGLSPKDAAKLRASISTNTAAFNKLGANVEKLPIEYVQAGIKNLARAFNNGATDVDKAINEAEQGARNIMRLAPQRGTLSKDQRPPGATRQAPKLRGEEREFEALVSGQETRKATRNPTTGQYTRPVGAPKTFNVVRGFGGENITQKATGSGGQLQGSYLDKLTKDAAKQIASMGLGAKDTQQTLLVFRTQLKATGDAQAALAAATQTATRLKSTEFVRTESPQKTRTERLVEYSKSKTAVAENYQRTASDLRSRAGTQSGFQSLGTNIRADMSSGMAAFNRGLAAASTGLTKFTGSTGGAISSVMGFGRQLRTNPLSALTKAAGSAANSLYSLGKSAMVGVGRGIGGVGGGVLGMLGFGKGRGAAAAGGGMGGGMMAMMLPMVGGMAIEQLSKSMGGETTDTGRKISSMGSQALNYGSTGAMIGSMFGPLGTGIGAAVGALAGLTLGFFEAEKAGKEYAQSQRQAASDLAMEKSGAAVERFAQSGTVADRDIAIKALAESSSKEAAVGSGLMMEKGEGISDFAKRRAQTQKGGADQAEKILVTEMMKSGKTFEQLSRSMNPTEFKMLAQNIAEADQAYAYFQTQRANEIARLKSEGRGAEAAALEARTITDQETLAKNIAERKLREQEAAFAAQRAAAASKALATSLSRAVMNLERTFDIMNQSMQRTSFQFEQSGNRLQEISSNQVSLASGQDLNRQINVLENPEAYGAAERNAALASSATMIGPQGNMTARISQFGPNARNEAMRIGNARALSGGTNAEVGADIKQVLKKQIEAAYGADTDIGRAAVNKMIANIDKAVQDAADNEPLDINAIVEDAVGPLMKASEQASKALIEANKMTILALTKLSEASQAVADAQQRQIDRTNALRDMQRESGLKTREALGIKVSGEDRIRSRTQGAAQRLGFANASDVNARNIATARQRAIEEQGRMMASKPAMEQAASTGNVNAARALVTFNTNLASVNQRIKDFDKELEDLPQLLEANLNDVLSEIQNRVNDLESRKEAGAAFLEKLVGSTPQELQELGRAYNTLENTLRGNIITINKSQSAQMAYVTALQQGKSRQEATMDAQSAFANETKSALSLFNDLTQMTGVKGAGFDKMRADLLENFARAQGAGLQNMPMFQKVLEELRKDPNQRAQDDPVLRALIAQADAIKQAQIDAVKQQNQIDRDIQKRILEEVAAKIIQDLNTARVNINVAVQQGAAVVGATVNRAKGGLIYASKGMLVNYEPKGTDTVPAMLTPGEFVVNRAATQRNLPLLQSINSGHMSKGGVVYLANGGTPSSTAFVQDNARMQNSILRTLSADISNIQSSTDNIGSTTSTLQNSSIPNLSSQNSETYKSLDKSSENISELSKELSSNKKSLSDFYNRFDTFSRRSKSTLASISDSVDFLVPAVVTVSDQMAEALGGPNNIQGLGTQLQAAFAGIGPVLQRALQNGIGNVGNMLGFSNGGIVYANNGMLIPYQPKGTDTVPAMLTPGEFVVNRAATQNNLPLLKAINNSKGGSISRYSSGGVVYAQDGWYQPGQPRTRLDRMMDEARNAPIRTAPPSSVGLGSASIGANTQSRAEREAGEMAYSLRYLPQEVPNESWFGPPTRKETEYERQLRLANSIGPDMSPGLESGKFVPNMFAFTDIIGNIGEAGAVRGGKPPSLRSRTKLPKGVTSPLLGSRYIDREVPTPSREKAISNTQALTALFPSDTGSSSSNRQSPTGPLSPAGEPLYTLGYGMIGGPKEELLAVIQAATQNFKAGGKPATIIDMLELKDIMRNDQAIRKQLVDLQRNGIIAAQNYVDPNVDEDEGTAIIGKPNNVISIRGLLKARESIKRNPDGDTFFPDNDTLGGLLGYSKDSREVFDMLQSKEIRDAVIGERSDYTAQWVQDQIANKRTMADIKQQLLEAKNKLMSEQSSEDDYILAPDDSKTSRSDRVGDRATDTTAAQRVRTYRREAIAAASDAGRSRTMPGVASPPPQSYDPSRTPMTQEEISARLLGLGPKPTSFQELTAWHRARIEKEFERDMEAKKTDRDDWVKELAIKNLERTRDEKLAVVDLLARSDEFAQQSQIRKNREFSFKRPSLGLSEETTLPYDELIAMVEAMSPESLKALAGRASLLGAGGNSAAWALDEALALYTYAGVGDPGRLFARHPNFKIQPRKSPKTEFESQFGQPIATIIGENNEYIASIIPRVSGVATSGADATGIGMIKGSKALDLLSLIGSYDENVFIRLFEDQLRLAKGNYGKGLSDAKLENMVFGQNRIVPIDVGGSGEKPIETFPTGQPFTEQSDLQSVILSDAWLKIMESQLSGPRRQGGGTLHNSIMELLATNPKAFLDRLSDFEYFPYEEDPRSNSNAILGDTARAAYIKIQQRILEKIRSAHKKVKQTYSSSGTEGSAQTADSSAVRKLLSLTMLGSDSRIKQKINTILQSDKALSSLDSILKQQNIDPKQLSYLSSGLESLVFEYGNEAIKITSAIKKPLLPLVNPVTAEIPIAGSNFRLTREAKLITEGVTSKDVQDMINTIWTEHGFNWTDAGTRQMGFHPETRQPLVFDGNFIPIDKTKPPKRMEPQRIPGVTKPEPPPLPPPTRKQNGGIIYASEGMLVNYQPRGTDTVPAMLTPGEFVVNKEATQANLPLLRSINSGYYAAGDLVVPQNQLMSSIRNRSMQRNIAGLDETTWFLASKYGRKQPTNFSGVVLEVAPGMAIRGATPADPNDPNRSKEDPTGLGNWQLAARVQANNLKQATEAMTTLVGNDAWRKKSQLINGAQLKNLMKFRENKVNNADQLVREIQYQRNLPSISGTFTNVAAIAGHGTPVESGAQPGVDTAGVNARANYLVTAIRANPAQAEGTVASMSKRIAAGIGASKTIDTAIKILVKDKRFADGDPALVDAKNWLDNQKRMYATELNYLGAVWGRASTILGTPVAGQPLIRLPALNITPQLYAPESFPEVTGTFNPIGFASGGVVYASKGMLVNYEPKGTDTVPAMLTPGEFVVNKASTQANLPLLQSINSGQYNKGGRISYLAGGTPGVDAFNKQMMLLTEILKISADNLQISFTNIIDKLNNFNIPEQNNGGVSNTNGSSSLAAIAALGTKLDQFILQLQQSIPPSITLEVPQPIPVNVNINGAAALQNLLSGPLSSMIQNIISQAFNAESRKREGQ